MAAFLEILSSVGNAIANVERSGSSRKGNNIKRKRGASGELKSLALTLFQARQLLSALLRRETKSTK